jgi:L-amino acid N-acyltransferase YncA
MSDPVPDGSARGAVKLSRQTRWHYAGIALPNRGSIALHERLGFKLAGTFHEVGSKFGKYWNVSGYEKELGRSGYN